MKVRGGAGSKGLVISGGTYPDKLMRQPSSRPKSNEYLEIRISNEDTFKGDHILAGLLIKAFGIGWLHHSLRDVLLVIYTRIALQGMLVCIEFP